MSNNFFQLNPSKLLTLKEFYMKGQLSEQEYLRMRKEALGINVYTGKPKMVVQKDNRKELSFSK